MRDLFHSAACGQKAQGVTDVNPGVLERWSTPTHAWRNDDILA
jgi:hypothetical protein